MLMVARIGHPLASRRRRPEAALLEALPGYPLLLPVSGTLIRHTADAFLLARGLPPPRCLIEATDTSFALGILRLADAVWFAPKGAVEGFIQRRELALLGIDTAGTEGSVGFTVRRNDQTGEGARLLIAAIRELIRASPRSASAAGTAGTRAA